MLLVLEGKSSQEYPLNVTVLQGYILSPTLFLHDLPDGVILWCYSVPYGVILWCYGVPYGVICAIDMYVDYSTLYSKF